MHLPDGSLNEHQIAIWWLAAGSLVGVSLRTIRAKAAEVPGLKVLLGVLAVISFIITMVHIPIPLIGSSAHMVGAALIALLIGPKLLPIVVLISLGIQALVFSHGGVSTLGANVVSMWIGGLLGWGCYTLIVNHCNSHPFSKTPIFIAGFVGSISVYILAALQLSLSAGEETGILASWVGFFVVYLPTQLPLAFGEGALTVGVLTMLRKRRPDIVKGFQATSPLRMGLGDNHDISSTKITSR